MINGNRQWWSNLKKTIGHRDKFYSCSNFQEKSISKDFLPSFLCANLHKVLVEWYLSHFCPMLVSRGDKTSKIVESCAIQQYSSYVKWYTRLQQCMYSVPSVPDIEADKEYLKKSGSFISARLLGFFSTEILRSVTAANSYHHRCGCYTCSSQTL